MDDQSSSHQRSGNGESEQPVRSRWTPKPEQILILETIFNSGMVNPPKEETIRIRKLLEKFGSVGDANVFYWFQNRRSRSRRRQRQIQATLNGGAEPPAPCLGLPYNHENNNFGNFVPNSVGYKPMSSNCVAGPSGLTGNDARPEIIQFSGQSGLVQDFIEQNPVFCSPDATNFPYQSEVITVLINGVATEVARGAVDIKGMFGGDFVLFHSSGVPVELNEYGFLVHGLQHGESYFLSYVDCQEFPDFCFIKNSKSSQYPVSSEDFLKYSKNAGHAWSMKWCF